jgi:hypothetical protein
VERNQGIPVERMQRLNGKAEQALGQAGSQLLDSVQRRGKHKDSLTIGKRLIFGGDFGWGFGAKEIFINASPTVGIKVWNRVQVGGGIVCQYLRRQDVLFDFRNAISYTVQTNTLFYGARAYVRPYLFKGAFLSVETELINHQRTNSEGEAVRAWSPVMWVGAGYTLRLGPWASVNIQGLYNPFYDKNQGLYGSPFDLRLGLQFNPPKAARANLSTPR